MVFHFTPFKIFGHSTSFTNSAVSSQNSATAALLDLKDLVYDWSWFCVAQSLPQIILRSRTQNFLSWLGFCPSDNCKNVALLLLHL